MHRGRGDTPLRMKTGRKGRKKLVIIRGIRKPWLTSTKELI